MVWVVSRGLWALSGVRYAHGFLYGIDIASLIDERCALRAYFFYNRSPCSLVAEGDKAR